MKRNVYLILITVITILCIIAGTGYHLVRFGLSVAEGLPSFSEFIEAISDLLKRRIMRTPLLFPGMINEWKEGDILHHLRSLLKARQLLIGLSEGNIISFMRP